MTTNVAERLVFPLPSVVLTKLSVSELVPADRMSAFALIDTVRMVLVPGAKLPLLVERLSHV